MSRLSDQQVLVLTAACERSDHCVFPVSRKLKGNAAGNVLKSLLKKKLIEEVKAEHDDTVWRHDEHQGRMTLVATETAFAALGIDLQRNTKPRVRAARAEPPEVVDTRRNQQPNTFETKTSTTVATRAGSKQATLIDMLRRPKGATIDEIAKALSWQHHTVRGAIAGALKKKRGLDVTSENDDKRGRIYRIEKCR